MKKCYSLLVFMIPILVWSQENIEIKPISGEKTLELQFAPFGDNPININGIRIRKFTDSKNALRLNAFVGFTSTSVITQQEDESVGRQELRDRSTTTTFNIRPGIEKHMSGTERLSPYFGLEADLALQTSSDRSESQNGTEVNFGKVINDRGFIRLGANAIAGFDYYVAKKLYLGTELGVGFSYTRLSSITLDSDVNGFTAPEPEKQGGFFDFGPNVNAQIRLGYAF